MLQKVVLNIASLNLVKPELSRLIKDTQSQFEQTLQAGADSAMRTRCRDLLRQVDGVFRLIELGDAAQLACEMSELVAQEAADTARSEALMKGFFILGRYLEYLSERRCVAADLLVDEINALRVLQSRPLLAEACFFGIADTREFAVPGDARRIDEIGTLELIRRLRHLYQVGLLGVMKGRSDPIHVRLMQRAVDRMVRLTGDGRGAEFWCLMDGLLEGIGRGQLKSSPTRTRLLTQADKQFKAVLQGSYDVPLAAPLKNEILFLIAKCRGGKRATDLQQQFKLGEVALSDGELASERAVLLGPVDDAMHAVVRLLRSDLQLLKERLENLAEAGAADATALPVISESMDKLAVMLRNSGMRDAADLMVQQVEKIAAITTGPATMERQDLLALADAVLFVETAVNDLARAEGMAQGFHQQESAGAPPLAREVFDTAKLVMLQSAREAIDAAKLDITSFVDTGNDRATLGNVPRSMSSVKGSLAILNHARAADIAGRTGNAVLRHIEHPAALAGDSLAEALADVLICIEYYIAALGNDEDADPLMLKLAEESLAIIEK